MVNILGTLKRASVEMISLNLVVDISKAIIIIEDKDFASSMIACAGGKSSMNIRNGKQIPILLKKNVGETLDISIKTKTIGMIMAIG